MSVSFAFFQAIAGCAANCVVGQSALSDGAPWQTEKYGQPYWQDNASIPNKITKLGFKGDTLVAGASVTIDLTALDGPDGGSGTVSLSTLICGAIQITSTTGYLKIGNAAANPNALDFGSTTSTRILLANSVGHIFGDPTGTGYTVSGSAKNVKLENTHPTDSVDYRALFGGQ